MDFTLAKHQHDFLTSEEKFVLLLGGIGSGKTWSGSHFVINEVQESEAMGFIGANTYKQLNNSTLACLFQEFDTLNIPFSYNKHAGQLEVFNRKILCGSLDNYNVYRGIEIGWMWLDEVRDSKLDAFKVLVGRLRHKKQEKFKCRLTTTPFGYNWLFDYFEGEKKTINHKQIKARTFDNPFLPPDYLDTIKQNYDEKMYRQEVLGEYINIAQGQVYYAFDREKNVKETKRSTNEYIWFGMDFNVDPMTAVCAQIRNNKIHVFSEIYLQDSNTYKMSDTIINRYGPAHNVVPDATGRALKTSAAGVSDHIILKQKGLNVISTNNPFRMDRYNCVNGMLERGEIIIDPSCKRLIKDLERVSFKEGTNMPETTRDKTLGHISDALGYLANYVKPIRRQEYSSTMPR